METNEDFAYAVQNQREGVELNSIITKGAQLLILQLRQLLVLLLSIIKLLKK